MWSRPKKEPEDPVRVQYPHPGQRFVDAGELLKSAKAREQIERMADLAKNNAAHQTETADTK